MLPSPNSNYIQNLPLRLQEKIASKIKTNSGYAAAAREISSNTTQNIPGVLKIATEKKDDSTETATKVYPLHKRCPTPSWISNCPLKSEEAVNRIKELNCQMECLLKNGLKNTSKLLAISRDLKEIFLELLSSHLLHCCKQGVDNWFWKVLFYNNIQYLKINFQKTKDPILKLEVDDLIKDGINFYKKAYSMVEEKYLEKQNDKFTTVAKVMAQKMLINVGNLYRYKTLISGNGNFELSSTYYMKAQHLLPANGVPFNQMAIISIYKKRTFDAVYYHVRSLMSSNSIQSANESLQEIFDKIRRKETELRIDSENNSSKKRHDEINQFRTEEWIYPMNNTEVDLNSCDIDNKSSSEILKRFHLIYLNLVGMLFTGIGMDDFDESLQVAIGLFSYLLKHHQSISQHELFQILTINIFCVDYRRDSGGRKEIFRKSVNLSSLFFITILETYLNIKPIEDKEIELKKYLQFLYIFSCWIQDKSYYDQYFLTSLSTNNNFVNVIKKAIKDLSSKITNLDYGNALKRLPENEFFNGFKPVTELEFEEISEVVENEYRLKTIFIFLTNLKSFYTNIFKSKSEEKIDSTLISSGDLNFENKDETFSIKPMRAKEEIDEEILSLSRRKEELQKQTKLDQICRNKFQEILKTVNFKVHIEIRPKYLVPDTNCFIDSLEELQLIANGFENYFLIVPLIVVKELDGLSRGFKASSTSSSSVLKKKNIHHFDEVSTLAKKSIEFIHNSSHVKCATTKGSILNSSMFSLEEDEILSNDDKILSTAIALQNQFKTEKMLQEKYFLRTEILLLTTDRNLRVKALTRNLVVRELKEFIKWAQKC